MLAVLRLLNKQAQSKINASPLLLSKLFTKNLRVNRQDHRKKKLHFKFIFIKITPFLSVFFVSPPTLYRQVLFIMSIARVVYHILFTKFIYLLHRLCHKIYKEEPHAFPGYFSRLKKIIQTLTAWSYKKNELAKADSFFLTPHYFFAFDFMEVSVNFWISSTV